MAIIRFFRTIKDGKPMTIALSEEAAWRSLDTYWAYDETERDRWSVRQEEREVPAVEGICISRATTASHCRTCTGLAQSAARSTTPTWSRMNRIPPFGSIQQGASGTSIPLVDYAYVSGATPDRLLAKVTR